MTPDMLTRLITEKLFRTRGSISKLGREVFHWSLPREISCPGATNWCLGHCYCRRGHIAMPSPQRSYHENFLWSKYTCFPLVLRRSLSQLPPCLLRIHCSGDFYSEEYYRAWHGALQSNPHVHACATTRWWRVEGSSWVDMLRFPGELFASTDPDSALQGPLAFRRAHAGPEPPPFPAFPCLNLRNKKIKCQDCGYCYGWRLKNGELVKLKETKRNVYFKEH